tara:strand:- start:1193 stop:1516 length:324 start_codon:yes stop_codon:yes gene_type:complete
MYKHHNPKFAEPLLKELLEKLGEDWHDSCHHDNLFASVSYEIDEQGIYVNINIPNSEKTNLADEFLGEFYIWISEFDTDTNYFGDAKTVDEAIQVAKKLLQTYKEAK